MSIEDSHFLYLTCKQTMIKNEMRFLYYGLEILYFIKKKIFVT